MKSQKELKDKELLKIRKYLALLNKIIICESCNLASRCCDKGYVPLLPIEVERFSKLSISVVEYKGIYFLKKANGHCLFFSKEKKTCSIYEERPIVCRLFPLDLSYENGKLVWSYFAQCPFLDKNNQSYNSKMNFYKIAALLERVFNKDLYLQFCKINSIYPRLEADFINCHLYLPIRPFKFTNLPLK